jgi:small subunit ribosomal protein S15
MKRATKKKIIKKHAMHDKDTGSAQVQIAIITKRINELSSHLQEHKKDNHSRRGLLLMVGKRRKLLNYLKNSQPDKYEDVIKTLELRK